jgi:hypothetical protein
LAELAANEKIGVTGGLFVQDPAAVRDVTEAALLRTSVDDATQTLEREKARLKSAALGVGSRGQ